MDWNNLEQVTWNHEQRIQALGAVPTQLTADRTPIFVRSYSARGTRKGQADATHQLLQAGLSLYSRFLDNYGMREFVDREFPDYLSGGVSERAGPQTEHVDAPM